MLIKYLTGSQAQAITASRFVNNHLGYPDFNQSHFTQVGGGGFVVGTQFNFTRKHTRIFSVRNNYLLPDGTNILSGTFILIIDPIIESILPQATLNKVQIFSGSLDDILLQSNDAGIEEDV